MKRILFFLLFICLLAGCGAPEQKAAPTESTPQPTQSIAPTENATEPTTPTGTVSSPTKPQTGWVTENEKTYYINSDGSRHIGWLKLDGQEYYLQSDGSLARGKTTIDGLTYYFAKSGARVILVNPWHIVPYNYVPNLVNIEGYTVDSTCRDALARMLTDCRNAGFDARIASAYRTLELQIELYNAKVNYYLDRDYPPTAAREEAAKVIAVPGTSEHQLGLAVDLVDNSYWGLDEAQEKTPAQKWLMEHCWEYGFILRYPNGKTDKTGIIYEPWHYRYVGKELAAELKGTGLCLEEYFDTLQ